jgi:hypothetical protein
MSGCAKLLKKATLRHSNACSHIVEAIYMGEKAHHLVAAGVGLNKRRRAEGRTTLGVTRTIPASTLPANIPQKVKTQLQKQRIPGAFLYNYNRKTRRREYTVVEVKYCRDTKPEDQETRAVEQHRNLVETIKKYDTEAIVKHCVLLLGVGGVIYENVGKQLSETLE